MNVIKDTIVNKNLKFIYSSVLFCYISYVANILCVECPIILCLDLTIRPLQTTAFLSHCSTPFSPPRLSTPTTLLSSTHLPHSVLLIFFSVFWNCYFLIVPETIPQSRLIEYTIALYSIIITIV